MNLKSYTIKQEGVDITDQLIGSCESITITDRMGVDSDSLDIKLNNDGLFFTDYFQHGDKIEISITDYRDLVFNTGAFYVDLVSGKIGISTTVRIGAVSQPMDQQGLQKYIKYNKKTVKFKTLLSDICKEAGLDLLYRFTRANGDIWDFKLKNVSHMGEMAGSVIADYVKRYGLYIKIHNGVLIVSDKEAFLKDPVLFIVDPTTDSIKDFDYNLIYNRSSKYIVEYYNPKKGKYITVERESGSKLTKKQQRRINKLVKVVESERVQNLMTSINDPEEALALAKAIDGQHVFDVSFTLLGNTDIVAGGVIEITELGKFSGKYLVTEAEHEISEAWNTHVKATALF